MMLAGTCPKRVLILAWTAVFAMSMGDEEGELTKAAIEEMNRAMLEGDEAGMGTHDSAEAKQRFAEEGNMAAYTLAGVEEQLMAPEGQIHHRMLGEHLLWMMRANGATAVQYYWQGNLERASRHYAIGVHAGRRYKAYEHHFNGQLTKNEDGHWAYMNEYKLNMLPLLAMLHRQRIRQGHITPSPRPQVSQRENGDEPETCKAKLDAFGAQTSPLAKKALARVPKISPSTLRVDFLEPSGENFFEMYMKMNRPAVFKTGLLDDWEAQTEWTLDNLVSRHGGLSLEVARGPQPKNAHFILSAEDESRIAEFKEWLKMQANDGWKFDAKANQLVRGSERHRVEPPHGFSHEGHVMQDGAKKMTLSKFVSKIMRGKGNKGNKVKGGRGNEADVEVRYVFNTLTHKGTMNGTHGSLWDDFDVPDPISEAVDGDDDEDTYSSDEDDEEDDDDADGAETADKIKAAVEHNRRRKRNDKAGVPGEDITTLPGTFEFYLGPAASGAHPHVHAAAWNGLVYGSKRWVLWPPGLLQENNVNVSVPAIDFFAEELPKMVAAYGDELYEFEQHAGEVVFVPESWGHAVLNLAPCVGVSRQLHAYHHDDPATIDDAIANYSGMMALDVGV